MKRVILTAIGLVLVVAVLCIPVVFFGGGSDAGTVETTTITDYDADFSLASDGDLAVVERITVDFPTSDKHGIFRFWDRVDPNDPHARRNPEDISVTMDDQPEPFSLSYADHERDRVAKIGAKSVLLDSGEHTYVIRYHIDGVIVDGERSITGVSQPSMFYWNLIPSGWQQPIDQSRLTVHLPVAAQQDVKCAVGSGGCQVEGGGTRDLTVTTGAIPAHRAVTIATGLDLATPPAGNSVPWSGRWDRVLGQHPVLLVVVALLTLVALGLGSLLGARSREWSPAFPLLYAPPDGIGPAQAKYIWGEDVDNSSYVATLMWAAEKGAVDLDRAGDTWTIKDKAGAQGWTGLDPVTTGTAHLLGGPGSTFTASRKNVQAGQRLKTEIASFETNTKNWARTSGLMTASGLGPLGGMVLLGGVVLFLVALTVNPLHMTMSGAIPGAFVVGGISLAAPGSGTRRTRSGRDLWSKVGGFRRVLATPSSKARFDFASRQDLYTAYIPWAVALDCADEWAAKYRTEMGSEPPVPHYFAGYYAGATTGGFVNSMVDSFSSTLDGAVSSYNATQSSSSGGGGGFSGGGGGGGGGGGSW